MELQHFQVQVHLIVGLQLILLVGICSCLHTSPFSSEVEQCKSNVDLNDPSIKDFSSFLNYISEPYFEKHDSLLDSDFQDYIAHIPLGSCEMLQDKLNLLPRLSALERYLIGEGSHRHLSSSITFNIHPGYMSELPAHFCEVIIIERLPSGIFADPFELQHLLKRGVFRDAAVFGDTNLELPSVASNRSVVEIHIDVGPNILSTHKKELEINVEIPLHARYPPVGDHGFSIVEFGKPDLLMRYSIEGKSHNQSCLFTFTDNGVESRGGRVTWKIPCGIEEHTRVVSFITFLWAGVSALLIVVTCIYNSDKNSAEG